MKFALEFKCSARLGEQNNTWPARCGPVVTVIVLQVLLHQLHGGSRCYSHLKCKSSFPRLTVFFDVTAATPFTKVKLKSTFMSFSVVGSVDQSVPISL